MYKILSPFWGILALSLSLFYCSNPVHEDGEDHLRPVGVMITRNDSIIVTYQKDEPTSGILTAPLADKSAIYELFLIAENGDTYQPDAIDHKIQWEMADTTVASIDWPADASNLNTFTIFGNSAGSTTATLAILHEDHIDYTSRSLPVIVQ